MQLQGRLFSGLELLGDGLLPHASRFQVALQPHLFQAQLAQLALRGLVSLDALLQGRLLRLHTLELHLQIVVRGPQGAQLGRRLLGPRRLLAQSLQLGGALLQLHLRVELGALEARALLAQVADLGGQGLVLLGALHGDHVDLQLDLLVAQAVELLAQVLDLRGGGARGGPALQLALQAGVLLAQVEDVLPGLLRLLGLPLPLLVLPRPLLLLLGHELLPLGLSDLPLRLLLRALPLLRQLPLHVLQGLLLLRRAALCLLQGVPPLLLLAQLLDPLRRHLALELADAPAARPAAVDLLDPAGPGPPPLELALRDERAEAGLQRHARLRPLQRRPELGGRPQGAQRGLHERPRLPHGAVPLLLEEAAPPLLHADDVDLDGVVDALLKTGLQLLLHEELASACLPRLRFQRLLVPLEPRFHLRQYPAAELLVVRVRPTASGYVRTKHAEAVVELFERAPHRVPRPANADGLQHASAAQLTLDLQ
mmetsp:Transcript_98802/g.288215  ORF Transcript_98802/g.288215 Transcript_98802/m.288215 type:complete len:482 (+) Transcript_98802:2060-3505(+)